MFEWNYGLAFFESKMAVIFYSEKANRTQISTSYNVLSFF